jgi:hypothetical protein
MEHYQDESIKVSKSDSRDPSLVKIQLFRDYSSGARTVKMLIDTSQRQNNESSEPFEFAGHHAGMPKQFVWAMSRNRQEAAAYLPEIIECVQEALAAAETPAA